MHYCTASPYTPCNPAQPRRDNLKKIMVSKKGSETTKYPISILFNFPSSLNPTPGKIGAPIVPFSGAIVQGTAQVMSMFLHVIFGGLRLKLLQRPDVKNSPDLRKELAFRFMKSLCPHALCDPKAGLHH